MNKHLPLAKLPAVQGTYIGSFEAVFDCMFGPSQHDDHVKRRRHYLFLSGGNPNYERELAAWRAERNASRAEYALRQAAE